MQRWIDLSSLFFAATMMHQDRLHYEHDVVTCISPHIVSVTGSQMF